MISAGSYIDSITVSYVGANDIPYGTYKMGGNGGSENIIQFSSSEFLEVIQGSFGDAGFQDSFVTVLKSFIFVNHYPGSKYGTGDDAGFEYSIPSGYEIIGFWGGAGKYVDRLGVVIRLILKPSRF